MRVRPDATAAVCLLSISLLACAREPRHTSGNPDALRPEDVKSFDVLYQQNCAGCHGKDGQNGPATDLANPEYEALIDDATLRDVTAHGQRGTLMPGFAKESGGPLTQDQIEVIVRGMRERWRRPEPASGAPAYASQGKANPERGGEVYQQRCAGCHGAKEKPGAAGSVLDGTFLGLTSDQVLRTTVIAGRPDLGMPGWRSGPKGQLTDQDVSDLVAWISSQRPKTPGKPYPEPQSQASASGHASLSAQKGP